MLDQKEVQDKFGEFLVKVVDFEPVKEGVLESFVFKPVKSILSFGLYEDNKP